MTGGLSTKLLEMLGMRVIDTGYSEPGSALPAHSALIWHQAKHSITLTFISVFYAVCVCVCVPFMEIFFHFFPGIQT